MAASPAMLNHTRCRVRQVRWEPPTLPCDRCGQSTHHVGTATRVAIDIALEGPVLLVVTVSLHHCPACWHTFRAQPPFLWRDAT
jgi:hypothetical protein